MGCDIHNVIEKKVAGKWITVSLPHHSAPCETRYYQRFGMLCDGIRGFESDNVALGIPADASETAAYLISDYGADGHNHSYMDLRKAAKICLDSEKVSYRGSPSEYALKYPESYYYGIDIEDGEEYRVVFWFDN